MIIHDFELTLGDSRDLTVTVKDEDGVIVDITGMTVEWAASVLEEGGFDADASISKSTGSAGGVVLTDPANGVFRVRLDAGDTDELADGRYFHQAKVFDGGRPYTVLRGKMTLLKTLI